MPLMYFPNVVRWACQLGLHKDQATLTFVGGEKKIDFVSQTKLPNFNLWHVLNYYGITTLRITQGA